MAFFTALDAHDAAVIAQGFGLGAPVAFTAVDGGTISSNFAFDVGGGRRVFVRCNDGKPPEVVAWESALAAELAAAGVPTPAPLATAAGGHVLVHRGLAISAYPWRTGRHLAADDVTPAHALAIGRALAHLHEVGRGLPAERRRAGIYTFADLVRRFDGFRDLGDPALAPAVEVLADELAWLAARAPVRAAAAHGLIHNDLFRDNVLWDGARIVAILDFEQAAGGSLVYDLAVVLNDWCWQRAPAPRLSAAVLHGYQEVRPLTAADRAALPVEVRAAAARFTITRITDVHLRQLDTPDKDFRAFLARLVAWRGPALGELLSSV
ncbi:MAG TPA: homoserine kinase [Kofleriaceae bacterium]|nr:homoserine kinase [Kofleriaceae bacterium]